MSSPLSRRINDERRSLTSNIKLDIEPPINKFDTLVTLDPNKNDRLIITGDDILIEYVKRVMI